jgi:hypothetical protein
MTEIIDDRGEFANPANDEPKSKIDGEHFKSPEQYEKPGYAGKSRRVEDISVDYEGTGVEGEDRRTNPGEAGFDKVEDLDE